MNEVYAKFETAKLLKEKGFDWEVRAYYQYDSEFKQWDFELDDREDSPSLWGDYYVSAPTQQMAMRWLREEKGIHICTVPDLSSNKFYVSIAINVNGKWRLHANFPAPLLYEKYIKCEDAIEVALEYALTKLI